GPIATDHRVDELPQMVLLVDVVDLEVGQRREAVAAPVDQALGPVDQPLLVKAHEDLADGGRGSGIHREPLALPVEREAHEPQLFIDPAAVLLLPLPDPLEEALAAEVVAREA